LAPAGKNSVLSPCTECGYMSDICAWVGLRGCPFLHCRDSGPNEQCTMLHFILPRIINVRSREAALGSFFRKFANEYARSLGLVLA
jgi:hypothetical protein